MSEVPPVIPKMTAAESAEFNKTVLGYFAIFAALVGMFSWIEKIDKERSQVSRKTPPFRE